MEPLSERILEVAETEIIGADIFEKWAAEVENLEDTRDSYKALYEQAQSRIEALERQVDYCTILEAENRILMKNAYPFGNFCCGLRDMGPGIHEAGCEIAAALAAEKKP